MTARAAASTTRPTSASSRLLRDLADAVVVGAGTVRAEGYRPNVKPLVVVTRSGELPPTLLEGDTEPALPGDGLAGAGSGAGSVGAGRPGARARRGRARSGRAPGGSGGARLPEPAVRGRTAPRRRPPRRGSGRRALQHGGADAGRWLARPDRRGRTARRTPASSTPCSRTTAPSSPAGSCRGLLADSPRRCGCSFASSHDQNVGDYPQPLAVDEVRRRSRDVGTIEGWVSTVRASGLSACPPSWRGPSPWTRPA